MLSLIKCKISLKNKRQKPKPNTKLMSIIISLKGKIYNFNTKLSSIIRYKIKLENKRYKDKNNKILSIFIHKISLKNKKWNKSNKYSNTISNDKYDTINIQYL